MKPVFFLAFFISIFSYGTELDCTLSSDECLYYLCIEEKKNCGPNGYLINFGHKYCMKFSEEKFNKFSKQGQVWVLETRECLIDKMKNLPENLSCRSIKKESFKEHADCYTKSGYCDLPVKDQWQVLKIGLPGMLRPRSWESIIKLIMTCDRQR